VGRDPLIRGWERVNPSPDQTFAVWVGRIQPFHLGHLEILRRSLHVQDLPHVNGIVCHDDDVLDELAGKHTRAYNPFTPWSDSRWSGSVSPPCGSTAG